VIKAPSLHQIQRALESVPAPPAARAVPPLRLCGVGLSSRLLEEAVRARQLPVELVEAVDQAEVVLSLRGQLGRDPERRRRAQELGLPILVIKAPSLHQIQRALERLLERRGGAAMPAGASSSPSGVAAVGAEPPAAQLEDAHGALEECRLAVERVVLPEGRPVELLPRSERVREMQAELVSRYRLRSAVFGRGNQQRLRVFPA